MLTHLSIQNFALIEKLSLDFTRGLVTLTGETGAGKSIIIDALSLALGKRGETSFIREGCDKSDITAVFDTYRNPIATQWLEEHDLNADEECTLRRSIARDGRSKSFINGRPAPLQLMREIGLLLVTLHGQHEHQNLLQTDGQQKLLDHFGKLNQLRDEVRQCFHQYRDLAKQLEEQKNAQQELLSQKEFLSFQAKELDELALQAGEIEELEKEQKKLANSSELIDGAQTILAMLDDSEQSLNQQLATVNNKLSYLLDYDDKLHCIYKLLDSASIQIQEGTSELQQFLHSTDSDPARLSQVDERLGRAYELARKHQVSAYDLPAFHQTLLDKLAPLESGESSLDKLQEQITQALQQYLNKASLLSKKRQTAAKKLSTLISDYMQKLGMKGGCFEVSLQKNIDNQPSSYGQEKTLFLVSTNPGSSLQPLAKVASGGELSRLSLAITVMTLPHDEQITLIFDEIDAGIGGATAACVGELLKTLSKHHQILCITHSPQVAMYNQQHFTVKKKIQKNKTQVAITELTSEQKIQEIARMVGGSKITESTLKHAKEMLTQA